MKKEAAQEVYVKSIVYGGLDGIITTFAVVAGVTGAALSPRVVLILGFANLIADAISMAAGDFLSTRAQQDLEEQKVQSTDESKNGTKLKEYFRKMGIPLKEVVKLVAILKPYKQAVTNMLVRDQLHKNASEESAAKSAAVTFGSFIIFGVIPLLTYIIAPPATNTFWNAAVITAIALAGLGLVRGKITKTHQIRSMCETVGVGGLAATAAYIVGALISSVV